MATRVGRRDHVQGCFNTTADAGENSHGREELHSTRRCEPDQRVTVKPLGPHELTQYTQDGVAYRIPLQPTAKLVIEFLHWLVTAEPVPPSAPPH